MASSADTGEPRSRRALPLPDGTIPVGVALLIAGVATYAFFRVGTLALGGDDEFAPIVALWFATFALVPGFFLPLEQELGRALAHRRAVGEGTKPVARKGAQLSFVLVAVIVAVIALASPVITSGYFDGDWWMLVALIGMFVAYAPAHLARGICSGSGRFVDYGVVLASDGVIRIVLCIVLAVLGVSAAGPYGLASAAAPLFALAGVWRRGALEPIPRRDDQLDPHGPEASWSEVTPNLGWLLIGSVFAAGLLNAGPITMTLLAGEGEGDLVTRFSYGVLLARVPLFLFQAVQAALLPGLSRLAARGELVEFRAGMRRLIYVVIAVGVAGTAGAFVLGPLAIRIVYDAELGGRTLAVLALASGVYMMALALGQAVIALRGHALVALGWGIGVVVFVLMVAFSTDDLFRRIEYGLFASSASSMTAFAVALRMKLAASDDTVEAESLIDAATPRKWA